MTVGLILAGGNGTRIANDISYASKVLIPIADRSLIQRNIDCIAPHVSKIVIVVGDSKLEIEKELQKVSQCCELEFVDKGDAKTPLQGMVKALPYIDDDVLMALGDEILIAGHVGGLSDNAYEMQSDMSLAMIPDSDEEDIAQCYSIEYDSDGYVTALVEKPGIFPNKDRGAGYFYIKREVFRLLDELDTVRNADVIDLFNFAISMGYRATSYHVAYRAFNINTIEELNKVKRYFR